MDNVQREVDQVQVIMHDNINKVLERDGKLSDLQDKSESLEIHAHRFQRDSTRLKRNMWWKDKRYLALIFMVLVIILLIIVIPIVVYNT